MSRRVIRDYIVTDGIGYLELRVYSDFKKKCMEQVVEFILSNGGTIGNTPRRGLYIVGTTDTQDGSEIVITKQIQSVTGQSIYFGGSWKDDENFSRIENPLNIYII